MQTACLRHMGKKLLVALTMEGKFAGEGLQTIDEDDDMLSAMARELVERNGIGETADAVWKALNAEHQRLFPTASQINAEDLALRVPNIVTLCSLESSTGLESDLPVSTMGAFGQPVHALLGKKRRGQPPPEQGCLFALN